MIPDALARAYHLLDQDMLGYLDTIEMLIDERNTDQKTVLAVARTEVPRLITALRNTVRSHRADATGQCLGCTTTARTSWPCPVIDAAHTYLKDPDRVFETHSPR
jgi:hypothetical protein